MPGTRRDAGPTPAASQDTDDLQPTFPPTEAPQNTDALMLILGKLDEFSTRLEGVEQRQRKQEQSVPRFQPMERPDKPHNPRSAMAGARVGEEREGAAGQLPVGTNGQRLPNALLNQFVQRFQPGDPVRINPEAERVGAEGVLWGTVLDRAHSDGEGTIRKVLWLSKYGEWKYKVRVPGLTTRTGDGFYDSELQPL